MTISRFVVLALALRLVACTSPEATDRGSKGAGAPKSAPAGSQGAAATRPAVKPAAPPPPLDPLFAKQRTTETNAVLESWFGEWSGSAELRFLDRPSTSFHMGMRIARTADPQRLEWTIVYGEGDARQERPYELLVDDAARGAFTVDERNGIAIPARLIGGTLWSAFAIEGTQVVTSYRLERGAATDAGQGSGERLVVEMLSFPSTVPITPAHDDVPPVTLYEPKTVQRAELRRTGGG